MSYRETKKCFKTQILITFFVFSGFTWLNDIRITHTVRADVIVCFKIYLIKHLLNTNDSTKIQMASYPHNPLKWQCHEIFGNMFGLKGSTWAPLNRQKRFRELHRFREDIGILSSAPRVRILASCQIL